MKPNGKLLKVLALGLICLMASQSTALMAVSAQETSSAQADEIVLAEGTTVYLVTAEEISSKKAELGDVVNFKVDEDVSVNGHVIISKGTPAKGRVMNAEKSGRMGKAGKLGIRVESTTTVDGQPIRIRAAKGREGDDKTNSVAALSLLVSSLFLLKKGGEATIKEGTKVQVYVDEEKRFRANGSSLVAVAVPEGAAKSEAMEGMATVYIYRPSKLMGKALEPSVFCDGVELGRMDNGRYLTLKLKPGRHTIHMTNEKKGFDMDMRGGEVYYFRVGIEMGFWKGQGKIMLDEREKGAAEIKKLKPLDPDKIKDTTMVVVSSNPQPER
ncbi:MAG TPA: DUF2846 domain-containing protein [Pyrinomonadaceae bacterium]